MINKIISYNVNGIRAAINKNLVDWIKKESPEILCIQELKAQTHQIEEALFSRLGYHLHWYPAVKKGYSGVGLLCKNKPTYIEYGIGEKKFDDEGRLLRVDFNNITVISTYFPSGTSGDLRQNYKIEWLDAFLNYISKLKNVRPNIIICGDLNICHKEIDINNPKRHHKSSGFLPEERAWMTKLLNSGFIDSFRLFNDNPNNYSWWSYRAKSREKNLGWRIDYNIASESIKNKIVSATILNDAFHSDHCPVSMEIDF